MDLKQVIKLVQEEVENLEYKGHPRELYEPMNYMVQLGGKRLRPVALVLAASLFGADFSKAINAAKGLEVFHNFTLVHDDIMDKAPIRRGQPTVHEKWNENIAILSGDALMIKVYDHFLAGNYNNLSDILKTFNKAAIEVCEGQQLDMNFEVKNDVTVADYIEMIRLKTSVLLGCAFKVGAIIGNATPEDCKHIYNFGEQLGLAFQLQDDFLDCFGDPEKFGKQVGGDIISNKKTYLMLTALNLDKSGELQQWVNAKNFDAAEKVHAVKNIYKELGVDTLAKSLMLEYYKKALSSFDCINVANEKKSNILSFGQLLMERAS